MPAIPHVVRRGAVYYWRRRLPAALAESRKSATLLLGLRTSDPRRARFLANQVTALVDLHFLPAVMTVRLNQKQIQQIFRDVFTRHLDQLEAVAARERIEPDFDPEESRCSDIVMGWVCRLLETRGANACVDARAEAAMRAEGLAEFVVAQVGAVLDLMKRQGNGSPPSARLGAIVQDLGAEPNAVNLAIARETYLRAMAEANFQTARRYDGARVENANVIADILTQRAAELTRPGSALAPARSSFSDAAAPPKGEVGASAAPNFVWSGQEDPRAAISIDEVLDPSTPNACEPVEPQSGPTQPATMALDDHPIVTFGERLIAQNRKDKSWDEKTQKQARQIYRLFGKFLLELSLTQLERLER